MDIMMITSALGLTIGAAGTLMNFLITHNLSKDLEAYKISKQTELEKAKSEWQGKLDQAKDERQGVIRKEVELFLGEKSAEREYNLEARKRLYTAIGPLRFQLLLACRDVAARITNYALDHRAYSMNMGYYYGQTTLYRLLRPVAIAELIEREITYADFSVDPTGIDLLRFKRAAFTAFTDGDSILDHPDADWTDEIQHVFSGTLSKLANVLIIQDEDIATKKRPMHSHEFVSFFQQQTEADPLAPLTDILHTFSPKRKPIFWIRLVCFGYICNEYVGHLGNSIGFQKRQYNIKGLLSASGDKFTLEKLHELEEYFKSMTRMSL